MPTCSTCKIKKWKDFESDKVEVYSWLKSELGKDYASGDEAVVNLVARGLTKQEATDAIWHEFGTNHAATESLKSSDYDNIVSELNAASRTKRIYHDAEEPEGDNEDYPMNKRKKYKG